MQITMDNAQIAVAQGQGGLRILHVSDKKSGIIVVIPLPPDAARTVSAALTSSLIVATGPLPINGPQADLKH